MTVEVLKRHVDDATAAHAVLTVHYHFIWKHQGGGGGFKNGDIQKGTATGGGFSTRIA